VSAAGPVERQAPTEAPGSRTGRRIAVCLIWFACVTSAGEVALWTFRAQVRHSFVLGPQYFWLIPIGYGVLFGAIGLVVWALSHWRWAAFTEPRAIAVGSFVMFAGWLFLHPGLSELAGVILALGLAVQAGRLAARFPLFMRRVTTGTMPVVSAVVIGLAVGFAGVPQWTEWRATRSLPPPVSASAPNVLLIVLDTVRASSMSLYGYAGDTTPKIDAFARRGVVFSRALSTSPWTLPSHGSMFTGRYPAELTGDFIEPMDATHPTLAEELAQSGYLTAGFVANTSFGGAEFGLARGFVHYEDHPTSLRSALLATSVGGELLDALGVPAMFRDEKFSRKSADSINRSFLRWMSSRDAGRPFFVFLNYFDAHDPYLAPEPYMRRFRPERPEGRLWSRSALDWPVEKVRELNAAYDGTIAYLDDRVGALLDELERRGELSRTIVVVTSDHGEQFGEHGLLEHASSLYMPLLHVPLVVVYPPSVPAGSRVDAYVTLRDLPATILDLAGLGARLPGRPLAPLWTGDGRAHATSPLIAEASQVTARYPAHYPARQGRMQSIVLDRMHYIINLGTGRQELYDLDSDPDQLNDLSGRNAATLPAYRERIETALTRNGRE
jgi:arylsulfatase A-like enzyme